MEERRRGDSKVPAIAVAVAVLLLMLGGAFVTEVVRQRAYDQRDFYDFDGFINYGTPIETSSIDKLGNPVTIVLTESRIEQPVFSTRYYKYRVWWYTAKRVWSKPFSPRSER